MEKYAIWHIPSATLVHRCTTKAEAAAFIFDGENDPYDFSFVGYVNDTRIPITITRDDLA